MSIVRLSVRSATFSYRKSGTAQPKLCAMFLRTLRMRCFSFALQIRNWEWSGWCQSDRCKSDDCITYFVDINPVSESFCALLRVDSLLIQRHNPHANMSLWSVACLYHRCKPIRNPNRTKKRLESISCKSVCWNDLISHLTTVGMKALAWLPLETKNEP